MPSVPPKRLFWILVGTIRRTTTSLITIAVILALGYSTRFGGLDASMGFNRMRPRRQSNGKRQRAWKQMNSNRAIFAYHVLGQRADLAHFQIYKYSQCRGPPGTAPATRSTVVQIHYLRRWLRRCYCRDHIELTRIQMSPAAIRFVVITWKELIAFGATELGTTWVLHFHQNFTGLNIQLHTLHCPWRS